MTADNIERSLVLIKPDALKNSLTGYILSQFSEFHTGLRFAALKVVAVNLVLASEHYAEHYGKFFYPSLLDYIRGRLHYPNDPGKRRVIAIIYQGPNAIKMIRDICGPTNPHDARVERPGCIRALGTVIPLKDENGKYLGDRVDNLIHASANIDDAQREIKLWFKPSDMPPIMRGYETVISREHFYYKDDAVSTAYSDDSFCFIAPGKLVWKSDMDTLQSILAGKDTKGLTVNTVVAKYLINMEDQQA
jgi:nucleoside-diphosphate kinase